MRRLFFLLIFLQLTLTSELLFSQNWSPKASLPAAARRNPSLFELNNKLYLVFGISANLHNDLWEYDPILDSWTRKANFPGPSREAAMAVSAGNFAYAGLGWSLNVNSSNNDFYRYDPISNTWLRRANFPGTFGRNSFFEAIGNKIFVGGGSTGSTTPYSNQFWEYNTTTNVWTRLANLPFGSRAGGITVIHNGLLYLGFGQNGSSSFRDLWRYNPTSSTWTQMTSFPGVARLQPSAFVISDSLIVGGGHTLGTPAPHSDYYAYSFLSNSWNIVCSPPVATRSNTKGITVNGKGYITCGRSNLGLLNDLIEFEFDYERIDTSICAQSNIRIQSNTIGAGATYLWNDGTTSIFKNVSLPGIYWVRATLNGCLSVDTFNVNIKSGPALSLGRDTTICDNSIITLRAGNPGATYLWQDNSSADTFLVSQAGLYWVEADLNGCVKRDSILVTYQSPPLINLGKDSAICTGDSIQLDARNSGANFLWQDNSSNQTLNAKAPGLYWVEVDLNGCKNRDSIIVSNKPSPIINLGRDTTICGSGSLILDATNLGAAYLWQDNSSADTFLVSQAGLYWVEADLNGCVKRDSIQVTYQPTPIINLGRDTALCVGDSILLDAGNVGANYLWQDNSSNQMLNARNVGLHWVEVDLNGCKKRDSILISNKPYPVVNLGKDTTICGTGSLTLDATNSGATYLWQDNSSADTLLVSQAGLYWVEVNLNGCIRRDSILVTYQSYPTINLGRDTVLCTNESLFLNAFNPGGIYQWQDNSGGSSFTVNQAGTYWVVVDVNGCQASDTINVTYKNGPQVNLGRDTSICFGATLPLNATNTGATYLWQDNSTASTFTVSQAGLYWVEVNLNGCVVRDSIVVSIQTPFSINLGKDTTLCEGESLLLDAGLTNASYQWSDNSTARTLNVTQAGTYHVLVNKNGCSDRDTVQVSYLPLPSVDLGKDTTICEGGSLSLNAANPGSVYRWQDNSSNQTLVVNQAGTYWVEVNSNNCKNRDTIVVSLSDEPRISFMPLGEYCIGESYFIEPLLNTQANIQWQDGSVRSQFPIIGSGNYTAIATNECGSDTLNTAILFEDCSCRIWMPNVFTPNKDGVNEIFVDVTACEYLKYSLMIFNRWGQKIFETNNPNTGWNGKVDGINAPSASYVYRIEYDNKAKKGGILVGTFTLIR